MITSSRHLKSLVAVLVRQAPVGLLNKSVPFFSYVENLGWLECAERYDRAHTLHYMDPPYWQTAGYGEDFPFENYDRMANFMRRCKGKVMVSINDHADIRQVFQGVHFETLDIRYTTANQKLGIAEVSGESLVMNWQPDDFGDLF